MDELSGTCFLFLIAGEGDLMLDLLTRKAMVVSAAKAVHGTVAFPSSYGGVMVLSLPVLLVCCCCKRSSDLGRVY